MQHECNTDYTIAKYIPYIKPKYVTQEGTTVLYVRYNYNRNKRTLISTGYNIKPEHWDAKRKWIKRACPHYEEIDACLIKITSKLGDILTYAKVNGIDPTVDCSVLNKLTLQKSKIKMKYSKKQYNYYSDDERMSYIREYLSSPESKSEFCKRHGFCAKLLTYWLNKYQIEDKDMGRSSKPVNSDAIDSSISELQKELSLLRAENRKLHRALADESLRHEACEELINLAESTYHIKVRKNSDAK